MTLGNTARKMKNMLPYNDLICTAEHKLLFSMIEIEQLEES